MTKQFCDACKKELKDGPVFEVLWQLQTFEGEVDVSEDLCSVKCLKDIIKKKVKAGTWRD